MNVYNFLLRNETFCKTLFNAGLLSSSINNMIEIYRTYAMYKTFNPRRKNFRAIDHASKVHKVSVRTVYRAVDKMEEIL